MENISKEIERLILIQKYSNTYNYTDEINDLKEILEKERDGKLCSELETKSKKLKEDQLQENIKTVCYCKPIFYYIGKGIGFPLPCSESCVYYRLFERINGIKNTPERKYVNYDYKAYRSQYTQNNDNKPLKYSSRIYLEKIIDKYYKNNEYIKKNRNKILDLNDKLEQAYQQVKDSKRKNSLNAHYRLYKLLQLCDKKYDLPNFKKISTKKFLDETQRVWKEICKINEWELID